MSDLAKPLQAREENNPTTDNKQKLPDLKSILPTNAFSIVNDILSQSTQFQGGFGVDDGTVVLQPRNNNDDDDNNNGNENEDQKDEDNQSESDEIQLDEGDLDSDDSNDALPTNYPPQTDDDSAQLQQQNKTSNNKSSDSDDEKDTHLNNNSNLQAVNLSIDNPDDILLDDDIKQNANTKNSKKNKADVGSRTMEQWLNRDNLIVHPVWIGNLPRSTTVNDLRHFVESQVGRVLVSIHISVKEQINKRTYAFLNLPTAEKQLLAVTLLDGSIFTAEKLIVRPKRPSKFPQSYFGSSPISEHFKHFRDCVVPAILANPQINLNVTSVRKILDQNRINIDHLPNRVWCVQCTLVPQCHRTYCSFYHCHQEKELGRIISILAAQICGGDGTGTNGVTGKTGDTTNANGSSATGIVKTGDEAADSYAIEHERILVAAKNPNTQRSRHTLLIQGLPRSITAKKMEEIFEVFGEIDCGNVIVNPDHTCYVRMKRSQDARKIVHLFKYNHAGVVVDFAPYGANKMADRAANNAANNNDEDDATNTVVKATVKKSKPVLYSSQTDSRRYSRGNRIPLTSAQSARDIKELPIMNPRNAYNKTPRAAPKKQTMGGSARDHLQFVRRQTAPINAQEYRRQTQNVVRKQMQQQTSWMHQQPPPQPQQHHRYIQQHTPHAHQQPVHPQYPVTPHQYYAQPTHPQYTATPIGYTNEQWLQYQQHYQQIVYQQHYGAQPTHITQQPIQPIQPMPPAMSQPMVANNQYYYQYPQPSIPQPQPQPQQPQVIPNRQPMRMNQRNFATNAVSPVSPTIQHLADSIPTPRILPPQIPVVQQQIPVQQAPPIQQVVAVQRPLSNTTQRVSRPTLSNTQSAPDPYYARHQANTQTHASPQVSATYDNYYNHSYVTEPEMDPYINIQKQSIERQREWLKHGQFTPYKGTSNNSKIVVVDNQVNTNINNNNNNKTVNPPQLNYIMGDIDPLSPTTALQAQQMNQANNNKSNEKTN